MPNPSFRVIHGDSAVELGNLPDESVHSIVTDPPYGLTTNKGGRGFMGREWDGTGIENDPTFWAECLRVLKPGGYLLSFGGSRTFHRMACAVEDAGFELRDMVFYMYASGFPKSHNVSKAIDKEAGAQRALVEGKARNPKATGNGQDGLEGGTRPFIERAMENGGVHLIAGDEPVTDAAREWDGWGSALKPAYEPIVVARKPFRGTLAANVQLHGTGGLNIGACRVGNDGGTRSLGKGKASAGVYGDGLNSVAMEKVEGMGRWPANVMLDESAAAILDADQPVTTSTRSARQTGKDSTGTFGDYAGTDAVVGHADAGGPSRFFHVFEDVHEGVDPLAGQSRMIYSAKAAKKERPVYWRRPACPCLDDEAGAQLVEWVEGQTCETCGAAALRVLHTTVKPLGLMRTLCRLVTPPGGIVLEPFAGSGTTAEAALLEGFSVIAIDREADHIPLINMRIRRALG